MKKSIGALVMALVLAVTVVPEATAAAKKGASCKKAGKTSVVDSSKFTCVKKGSKLVWNKGKVVKKAPMASPSSSASPMASPSSSAATTAAAGYTMAQVKANSTSTKCWSAIKGNVYDLTKWINQHPGGSGAIQSLCGMDGSTAFARQHQGQRNPESRLNSYLLGPLAK